MNKWVVVSIVGVVILVIGIGLAIYGADSFGGAVSSSLNDLKIKPFTTLTPGGEEQISVPANSYDLLLYNSTMPLQLKDVNVTYAAGIYEAAIATKSAPVNYYLVNNNSVPVEVKYVLTPVDLTQLEMASVGILLLFAGFIIAIAGGVIAIISRFRKKRSTDFGQPPTVP
ncbi:LapA family protein [Sulfuracidifex tepidarius]|uniref:Uncharacterized protein n=1 Tax=Sulfuracidifex tepidarius TaxID=1294262 RepID=A0A510E0L0_9CREN|nr:LapA family protein [Sulfuracidifex tepidarius]BBG23279.1 hypothetical protein IC006_0563 [Sulfuracidifex tepidarius]BBG26031.1 hypothetical protein IC007_0536 [Sulfuracidifex tepidarius]